MLFFSAKVVTDRVSEKSKGYGFVTFASQDEAENAIAEMNEKVIIKFAILILFLGLELRSENWEWEISLQALNGRVVFVDYAKPDTKRSMGMPIARGPPEVLNKQEIIDSPQDMWDTIPRFDILQ